MPDSPLSRDWSPLTLPERVVTSGAPGKVSPEELSFHQLPHHPHRDPLENAIFRETSFCGNSNFMIDELRAKN